MGNWLENQYYREELEELCKLEIPYANLQNQNILITGANGLIGSYLVDVFMKMNTVMNLDLHVTALTRSKEKSQKRFADYLDIESFDLLIGDVCHREIYKNRRWDYIIHGAGNAHPKAFSIQPVETMKANLLGTMNILDYAVSQEVTNCVKKVILLSTGEIYGHAKLTDDKGWKESDIGMVDSMEVRSCYPEGKRAAETLCQSYYQEYGIRAVVARLCYIYGATIQSENTRADAQFLRNALRGETIVMKSEGKQVRSYCYLQDAAAAILFLLLEGKSGEAYNVANADSVASIKEYAECMATAFGVKIRMELPEHAEQKGYSKMQREILDAAKLRELGWRPGNTLPDGMKKIKKILK
ncbi:MAG: NAD-dependent epimerase/dehydratase family protein [Lachnospiraceae bacterium]|nr:NAD-dependent epimerase/dehydratase family protein [Lachnospiraceae bacterium]